MADHMWGDGDFNWKKLSKAGIFICFFMNLFGFILVYKEKYGTLRYEWLIKNNEYFACFKGNKGYRLLILASILAGWLYYEVRYEIVDDLLSEYADKVPWFYKGLITHNDWTSV